MISWLTQELQCILRVLDGGNNLGTQSTTATRASADGTATWHQQFMITVPRPSQTQLELNLYNADSAQVYSLSTIYTRLAPLHHAESFNQHNPQARDPQLMGEVVLNLAKLIPYQRQVLKAPPARS